MSWYPIAFLPPQYVDSSGVPYSGAVLKAYAAGTSTPISMATSYLGSTLASSLALNAAGYPTYLGTIVIPHIQEDYKLALYPTQAAADANSGAVWEVDNIKIAETATAAFVEYFDGDNSNATFTLSQSFGTDEKILMVFADRRLPDAIGNGAMASDTIWTKGVGWTIAADVATATGAISTALSQTSLIPIIQYTAWDVEFTVTASAGTLTPSIGGNSGTTRGAGTWRETIIAGSTQVIAFTGVAFTGTLDNVTVTPVMAPQRQILSPDEYTLVGNQLTISYIPPTGTKNVGVYAPSALLGAANNAAAAAATSETNAAASAAAAAADAVQTAADRVQTGADVVSSANSAAAAAAAAAGGLYNNVDAIAFADSPFVPLLAKDGYLWRIDTSGGNVVVDLSSLATYAQDIQFAFVKVTADANTVTVNRGGTDTINGATSLVLSNQFEPHALIGDLQTGTWLDTVQSQATADGSVTNAKLADMVTKTIKANITGSTDSPTDETLTAIIDACIGSVVEGDMLYRNGTVWTRLAKGTALQTLQMNSGATAPEWGSPAGTTLGTLVASTSGTNIDFTGIPAGTKEIIVSFNQMSTNGTSDFLVQIGDSGGIESSGYVSGRSWTFTSSPTSGASSTAGFIIGAVGDASYVTTGQMRLVLMDAATNLWSASFNVNYGTAASGTGQGGGTKALSATLDRVRITTVSGHTFDNGSVNIAYRS